MSGAYSSDREGRGLYNVLVEIPEGKGHLRDPGVDGRIILRWIFRKGGVGLWTGLGCLWIEAGGGNL
jgi:hypothetical protein